MSQPPTYRVVTCPKDRCDAWALVPAAAEAQHRRDWASSCHADRSAGCIDSAEGAGG